MTLTEIPIPPASPRRNPWPRRIVSVALTAAIAFWMVRKVARHWADVRDRIGSIHLTTFVLAAAMFAAFLFAFRAMVWRRIVRGFGYPLPVAPAVRVWSTSELARYVPGVILQVAGRVYLVKPYGVPGTACTASQLLELILFLQANVLVAVGCLVTFGLRHVQGKARAWLVVATLLVPLLALLLHPRVFYGALERVTRKLKKPPVPRLSGAELAKLLGWNLLGLAWQSVAAFLIIREPLGLGWDKLYVVAGTYCLAWCGGFLAFWSPGGLFVREPIFATVMAYAVPDSVVRQFPNRADLIGLLTFVSVVLRLWTIAGEVILTTLAHAADVNGTLGRGPPRVTADDAELVAAIPTSD
jgi:hypothetical protein